MLTAHPPSAAETLGVRRGLLEQIANAIYDALVRRMLKTIGHEPPSP